MSKTTTVMLVDDHSVVRAGYKAFLTGCEGITVLCEASTGEEACLKYSENDPDVVVMDLNLPGIGGLGATRRILARDPAAKILIFSMYDEPIYVNRALDAGAKGYISKSADAHHLVEAVLRIGRREMYIEPELAQKLAIQRFSRVDDEADLVKLLSPREFDVFCLLSQGLSSRQVSEALKLSIKTVANYSTNIKIKLNVKTTGEMVLFARDLSLLQR